MITMHARRPTRQTDGRTSWQ